MEQTKINQIRELSQSGKTQTEIAKELGISQKSVSYWLSSDEKRKEISKKIVNWFKHLPLSERQRVYKNRLPYLKKYQKMRYHSVKEFRDKQLERVKKYYTKMKGGK